MSPERMPSRSEQVVNALTVDLEDWYHGLTRTMFRPRLWPSLQSRAQETIPYLLDLLAENKVQATFFVLGHLADQIPSLIKRIVNAGHELGSHGYSHQRLFGLTPTEFRDDLSRTRLLIEDICGVRVICYRAPQFSINQKNQWAFEVLAECGYKYDSSVFPTRSLLYGYPGAPRHPYQPLPNSSLMEYPVATINLGKLTVPIAGGVYNRILPAVFIRWGIQRINKHGYPAIIYMHPWEFDLHQPNIRVNPRERVTHFIGRSSLALKFRYLVSKFSFAPLGIINQKWKS